MADDPLTRLEAHGQQSVPPPEAGFADRLEAQLRVSHAQAAPSPNRRRLVWLPRLGIALALVVVGLFGAVALTGRDAGGPVVVDAGVPSPPADLADAPPVGGDQPPDPVVDPSPTPALPTPTTAQPASPTPTTPALPTPTTAQATSPTPTTAAVSPDPTMAPTLAPTPAPTTAPTPSPTESQRPTPSPTAIAVREPAVVELACAVRAAGDSAGVACSWEPPAAVVDVAEYELSRSRNGAGAVVVAHQRPGNSSFVDRDVVIGDRLAYVVRGLDGDGQVVAASAREIVEVAVAR